MDNPETRLRCVSCGHIDTPVRIPGGPGWLAIALWGAAGLVWAIGFAVNAAWLSFLAGFVLLGAMVYTLWYFYKREKACRHCGARTLEPAGT